MAKTKRGKALWNDPTRGRGTCPACSSTRIKLLYSRTTSGNKAVKVCKKCANAPQVKIDAITV
ncbi:hypothetical protein [Paenibacillus sp. YIM B09110]|uniref:hypothetical protein n=1 Tax=unclassified Paenibacillus TaxID=185978 RepID=UPI00301D070D